MDRQISSRLSKKNKQKGTPCLRCGGEKFFVYRDYLIVNKNMKMHTFKFENAYEKIVCINERVYTDMILQSLIQNRGKIEKCAFAVYAAAWGVK